MATTLETPPPASAVSAQEATVSGGRSNERTSLGHLTIAEVLEQLGVDAKADLSSTEAQKRMGMPDAHKCRRQ
jgi:hypothetical protein